MSFTPGFFGLGPMEMLGMECPRPWRGVLCCVSLPQKQIQTLKLRIYGKHIGFLPIGSMYGIFTYMWFIFMVNVGKYTIHGSYGLQNLWETYSKTTQV